MSKSSSAPSPRHDCGNAGDGARNREPGAPKGNLNAKKHGAYLNEKKRGARALRDRHRRRGEREARAILQAHGLGEDPLARLVARQMGRLEAMVHRLEAWHEVRGYFTAAGELKASVAKEIEVIGRLLDEARKILDNLRPKGRSGDDPGSLARIIEASYRLESERVTPPGPRVSEGEGGTPDEATRLRR